MQLWTRHAEKMRKRQAARAKIQATKTIEKGLLIVNTGKGKGKSTTAFGLMLRAIGHGMCVGVIQFIKGGWETGEGHALKRFPDLVSHYGMHEGFTWDTQDRRRDIEAARSAKELIADAEHQVVVFDQLNIVLRYDYLQIEEVLEALATRPRMKHVVITSRNAPDALIERADW